jgi:hypothetical protein
LIGEKSNEKIKQLDILTIYCNFSSIFIAGGAGFLGQHIVRLLQEGNHTKVKEIRIVDLKPYENRLSE